MLVMATSICMMVFYGALTCLLPFAIVVTQVMAAGCAISGLLLGAHLASTSTNREYLIRKLLVGAFAGLILCIVLMIYAVSNFKFFMKEPTFAITIAIYVAAVTYLGYVVVFVLQPGHAEHKDDYIWGVIRMYIHVGIVVVTLFVLCLMLFTDKEKEKKRRRQGETEPQ